jgi:3',5'-cyclic AMP phosphodiesterase CpdA
MDLRPPRVFFALWTAVALMVAAGAFAEALPTADTLTVIQRPLINIPSIVRPGDTLSIECDAAPGTSGWTAGLVRGDLDLPMTILDSTYDPSTLWWEIKALVPGVPVYELYDLRVAANGGIEDTTWHSVSVIPEFKDDYYFIHITDTHMPTHKFYYERGADTDTSEIVDFREIMRDVNVINPEFVLITGDFVNEGELEEFLDKHYFSRTQVLLKELDVPVYLTTGNHDVGGWDDTPPPDGNSRRNWWRFFGWKRCDDPPAGAPWYTQNYSFDYGPVHYVGLDAYLNYENWRPAIYGSESFTSGQLEWLADDLAAHSGSASTVLFYHNDFAHQINLGSLGVDMALWGHTHSDHDDYSPPYDISTESACDGNRAYRLIRVSNGVLEPTATLRAGSNGSNLDVTYSPANDGTHSSVTANITNNLNQRFEHGLIRFIMPNEPGTYDVSGGTLVQTDVSGPYAVCYAGVDIAASSSQSVTMTFGPSGDTQPPVVTVLAPNGGEVWDVGTNHEVTWTASDDVGVASLAIVLSVDRGNSFTDTLSTGEINDGAFDWFIESPATDKARIKIVARDDAGNVSEDMGDADFQIYDPDSGAGTDARVPAQAVINSNSPNPFSTRTVVRFGIPERGYVEIALYDVSGRRAATVAAGVYSEGYHDVVWENDGTLGTGLYLLRLRFGSDEVTHKIVVSE